MCRSQGPGIASSWLRSNRVNRAKMRADSSWWSERECQATIVDQRRVHVKKCERGGAFGDSQGCSSSHTGGTSFVWGQSQRLESRTQGARYPRVTPGIAYVIRSLVQYTSTSYVHASYLATVHSCWVHRPTFYHNHPVSIAVIHGGNQVSAFTEPLSGPKPQHHRLS